MYRKPSHPHRRSQRRSYDHYGPQNRRPRNLNLGSTKPSNRGRWNNGSSGSWVPTNSKNPGWLKRSSGGSWGSSQHNNAGWQKGSTSGSWGHFYVVNSDLLKSSAGESSASSNAKDARVKSDYAKGNTPLPLDLLDQKKKTLLNSMSQEPFKPKEDSEVEVVKVVCRPQPIVITPMERVEIHFRHEKEALTGYSFSYSLQDVQDAKVSYLESMQKKIDTELSNLKYHIKVLYGRVEGYVQLVRYNLTDDGINYDLNDRQKAKLEELFTDYHCCAHCAKSEYEDIHSSLTAKIKERMS